MSSAMFTENALVTSPLDPEAIVPQESISSKIVTDELEQVSWAETPEALIIPKLLRVTSIVMSSP